MSANIGWLFYRDYFNGIDYAKLSDKKDTKIQEYIEKKVANITKQTPQIVEENILGNVHFKATTTYPGVLLGSGNAHELPSIEGQLSLGFSFDYTTGLPVIAGSSIKGVLRSAFSHPEYIQELLGDDTVDVRAVESDIFDNRDIFFDAVVTSYSTQLLDDDFLTPHDEEGIKNPIPIRFLKVMPAVTYVFDFYLKDGLISKDRKRKLFEAILADLGLGAKTNVGYGKFENFAPFVTKEEKEEAAKVQFQESFQKAKNSQEIGVLESFISQHRGTQEAAIIEETLIELRVKQKENTHKERNDKAQLAYDALLKVKGNQKKFVKEKEKFIKKWAAEKNHKKSPFVLELLEKVKAL